MRISQNGPLEKFMQFLFIRLNVACVTNIWRDNIYADTNLCNRHLTRINKTRAEKCRFTVIFIPPKLMFCNTKVVELSEIFVK